jgi:hypothetical protein
VDAAKIPSKVGDADMIDLLLKLVVKRAVISGCGMVYLIKEILFQLFSHLIGSVLSGF